MHISIKCMYTMALCFLHNCLPQRARPHTLHRAASVALPAAACLKRRTLTAKSFSVLSRHGFLILTQTHRNLQSTYCHPTPPPLHCIAGRILPPKLQSLVLLAHLAAMQTTLGAGNTCLHAGSRSSGQPSTSSRRPSVAVRAKEKMCRDMVSAPKAPFQSKGVTYQVTFQGLGDEKKVVDCPDDMYILDAAEAAGLDLPATCRGGICGACVGRVASGAVDMSDIDDISFTLSDDEVEQGMALLCMARVTGDATIETQCDWGYSLGVCEWKGATGRFSAAPDPLMGSSWSEAKQEVSV